MYEEENAGRCCWEKFQGLETEEMRDYLQRENGFPEEGAEKG